MRMFSGSLVLLLATGVAAHGQGAGEPVVKLPDQIEWKAPPMVGGASTAILYGDPSKPGVYVTRTKFPAGLKVMPHTHPDEWRTVVVLSGTNYFGLGDTWDESKLKAYPTRNVLLRAQGYAALRLGQGWRGNRPGHGHGSDSDKDDPAEVAIVKTRCLVGGSADCRTASLHACRMMQRLTSACGSETVERADQATR